MELPITLIVIVAVALLLLKYARKFASKILSVIVIVALVVGFMYYRSMGPFKNNMADLSHLNDKYCGDDGDQDICDCILKPAIQDIETRFNGAELDSLKQQKIRAIYVLQKSLKATEQQALVCLAAKGATSKYKVFLQDFVPIENKYLDLLGDKAKDIGSKVKDEILNFKENKKVIDEKY